MSAFDIFLLTAVYLCGTVLTLAWVFFSKQPNVERSGSNAFCIAFRILFLHVSATIIACWWLEYSAIQVVRYSPVVVIGVLLANRNVVCGIGAWGGGGDGIDGLLSIAFFIAFIGMVFPFYCAKQFVLGFPDRHHIPQLPEPHSPSEPDLTGSLVGETGTVTATLRPQGIVDVDGVSHPARHVANTFVETGTRVIVSRAERGTLFVKNVAAESD